MMLGGREHGEVGQDVLKGNRVTCSGDWLTFWSEKCMQLLPMIKDG